MPSKHEPGSFGQNQTHAESKVELPKQYRVLLHNDDYTPMEFVVDVLMNIFLLDEISSMRIMLNVHKEGRGICGIFSFEVAESKIARVHELASKNEYPLRASMEEA
ncbi:MAG: ATP-dependent Clp protease adaptor ClpS [Candidatus Lambdaproteobacteria bacterium RIFOXYD12_FULL_49_8]|uniref:ATP-dependent Clp protease adapter protein ClpS n=1 Tax=Candidatus Lambdaproteobacteria bacterium RIFOXYD2_FULL_50_16 TaxID=1817772 RepID=A0A1F6G7R9_9PROT|nr:MAG: ATP-dependent Clp protease adaptor ClpS [Candidatus Lambdaproteobacteria bacterium RIFOXYD2_FULL_50_16]OGG98391.1 MAG: ATP-dependent Clp protease adaptor ClpS [Candidatus Lambdaproteobacteria bacterium RIFOXYD12_FULL_49_8]